MNHPCLSTEYKEGKYHEFPHYFDSCFTDSPIGDGVMLTTMYTNKEDNVRLAWGMMFKFCPACGEKLKNKR